MEQHVLELAKLAEACGIAGVVCSPHEIRLVRKAVVMKSDNALFNVTSVLLAYKYKFTPARMNGKPVAVWVTIPFRYRLKP